jgi:hypothetical protein
MYSRLQDSHRHSRDPSWPWSSRLRLGHSKLRYCSRPPRCNQLNPQRRSIATLGERTQTAGHNNCESHESVSPEEIHSSAYSNSLQTHKSRLGQSVAMPTSRELAAAFGVLIVGQVLLGLAIGFFAGLSSSFIWVDSITALLVLIFTPIVMLKARWTALGAVIVGVVRIATRISSLMELPTSLWYGPVPALVLALLFTYFSFQAYRHEQ